MRLRALALLLASAGALAAAPAVQAATVEIVPGSDVQAIFRGTAASETISVSFSPLTTQSVTFVDSAGLTPGPGCGRPAGAPATTVTCRVMLARGNFRIQAELLGGNDRWTSPAQGGALTLDAGLGQDEVTGSVEDDTIAGGPGADVLRGGPGADVFDEGAAASGGDVFTGGGGNDRVSYAERRARVVANLSGGGNGEAGESDRIAGDIEILTGGRAADRLRGGRRNDQLNGGAGATPWTAAVDSMS